MTSFIPSTPTLAQIATTDTINYKGQTYAIASVDSVVTHPGGTITSVVTLATVGVHLTLETSNTILSSYSIDAHGVTHAVWVQSVKA
jgi:hypothetical protein